MPVFGSQPAGDVSHKPGGRLSLLTARPAINSERIIPKQWKHIMAKTAPT